MFKQLYIEIERILPSLQFCLAPKKEYEKKGAASLRSGATSTVAKTVSKDPAELDKHSKILYEWLDIKPKSRIRMMMNWQAAGGLSFVACTYHRGTQCFRYFGNSTHEADGQEVSLKEFQDAIKIRHSMGSAGTEMDATGSSDYS